MPTNPKPTIALLAAPEVSPSILYGLYDILASVGVIWPDMTSGEAGEGALDVFIVGRTGEPFRCSNGILVEPRAGVADVLSVDVAIVADFYTPSDLPLPAHFAPEIEWLRRMHAGGALLASVCTGSLLLAATGLLDGRSSAGHWSYVDRFRLDYPRVRFDPAPILDLASETDGLITSGGGTSWHELALHLIARYVGPRPATETAKIHLLAGHEDGQLPFSSMIRRGPIADAAIDDAMTWIGEHHAAANPVSRMIERSGLTPRTFSRRFLAATRYRPIDYVHAIRIERARELLERCDDPVDDVGFTVGYGDPTFFRRLFRRTTGMTPAAYRRKYAPIAGAAD